MSFSKIFLVGRLGKDPHLHTTNNGKTVCNFSIAVDSGSGEHKKTTWFNISAWGKPGEAAHKYLTKGSEVAISGTPTLREFERSDGSKGSSIQVDADAFGGVTFLSGGQRREQAQQQEQKQESYNYGPPPMSDSSDDDVPF